MQQANARRKKERKKDDLLRCEGSKNVSPVEIAEIEAVDVQSMHESLRVGLLGEA